MQTLITSYKINFRNKTFVISFFIGLIALVFSLFVNYYAGVYATERASSPVTDLILSNIRVYDVDGMFVYGIVVFFSFLGILCILKPQRLPFTMKTLALFIVIRSLFVTLTHLGPFPTETFVSPTNIISDFSFGADLFFSGHTGAPFLMAFVFWDNIYLRWLFFATSLFFGVIVLLGHLHYSIDVLSAFFISYGIYKIAEIIFKKDQLLFKTGSYKKPILVS